MSSDSRPAYTDLRGIGLFYLDFNCDVGLRVRRETSAKHDECNVKVQ